MRPSSTPTRKAQSCGLAAREKALGGVPVIEDATDDAFKTAQRLVGEYDTVIIDTPGFRSQATLACLGVTDFVLVPVKPSPFDVDRMLDTLNVLINGVSGRRPVFRCVLTQTTRESVIAKHIRSELAEAGFPVLDSEMTNRVVYAEAALWGATPSLLDKKSPAAREIAAIADEVEQICESTDSRQTGGKRMNKKEVSQGRPADGGPDARGRRRAAVRNRPDNVIEMMPKSEAVADREYRGAVRGGISDPAAALRRRKAIAIVERYANYSAIGGAIPVPLANAAAITALLVRMVKSLSELYERAVRAQPHPLRRHRPDGRRAADGLCDDRNVDDHLCSCRA